jgi:hypothetical protein
MLSVENYRVVQVTRYEQLTPEKYWAGFFLDLKAIGK